MRKYLRLIFKGLGILSLVIAVGIFVAAFFFPTDIPPYDGNRDHCESHYCISTGPKGSEKFKGCVSDCMEKIYSLYSKAFKFGLFIIPVGIIFFIVLGVILLIISYVISLPFREEDHSADHTSS